MAVVRWRPLHDLTSMQREMNRLFDSFFSEGEKEPEFLGNWSPSVDVKETADAINIIADLPGLKKDDIKITLRDNTLQISGEKKKEEEEKDATYHRVERVYGAFSRTFTLPAMVDSSKINAVFKDGELRLTLPKVEEAKPKEISIKAE